MCCLSLKCACIRVCVAWLFLLASPFSLFCFLAEVSSALFFDLYLVVLTNSHHHDRSDRLKVLLSL